MRDCTISKKNFFKKDFSITEKYDHEKYRVIYHQEHFSHFKPKNKLTFLWPKMPSVYGPVCVRKCVKP